MTELLYHHDSYTREFEAQVVRTIGSDVILDRTAFYPGGGGQPHDQGVLSVNGAELVVTRVRRDGADVLHGIDGTLVQPGDTVVGRIDWNRRYQLMRTHTALHLLCGIMWHEHGVTVTGGNMEPGSGRLDFDFPALNWEIARAVERRMNAEVEAARAVVVAFHSRDAASRLPDLVRTKQNLVPDDVEQVRTIEIVGLDLQADGGTHVANTREVGQVQVVGLKNKGRANKRVEIALA